MIILGNKFDGENYQIEDTKTNEVTTSSLDEIIKNINK